MDICAFTNGSYYTQFVGKKSLYKSKEHFAEECRKEFCYILENMFTKEDYPKVMDKITSDIVHDNLYCRFYPRMPEEVAYLDLDEGYLFCEKGRGAFEVFVIDLEELKNLITEEH